MKREVISTLAVVESFRWSIIIFKYDFRAHLCICPIIGWV